jgi:hypothetical protein
MGTMASLSYGLIAATFLVNQIHLATAACTNSTSLLGEQFQILDGVNPLYGAHGASQFQQKLDFISCPSSSKVNCTIPPKTYNITISPQFNISSVSPPLNISTNAPAWERLDAAIEDSHVTQLPADSQDYANIVEFAYEAWLPHGNGSGLHIPTAPTTFSVTTQNITQFANLTIAPGYNMTLTYEAYMASIWAEYDNCDNKSLDGLLIGVITPWYGNNGSFFERSADGNAGLVSTYIIDIQSLNNTVVTPDTKGSGGIGLKAGNGFATALIALGVVGLICL